MGMMDQKRALRIVAVLSVLGFIAYAMLMVTASVQRDEVTGAGMANMPGMTNMPGMANMPEQAQPEAATAAPESK